jgi:hypothetical protein
MYNIYLNSLPPVDSWNHGEAKRIFKELACENGDMVDKEMFPTIICRYANEYEVKLITEIADKTQSSISVRPVDDNVFDHFDSEIAIDEQLDTHLLERGVIEAKLISGIELLKKKKEYQNKMEDSSSTISELILDHYDKTSKASKFKPTGMYGSFILWIVCSMIIFLAPFTEKLFFCSLMFVFIMSFSMIYDYVQYKKLRQLVQSNEYFDDLIAQWTLLCYSKNQCILDVEDMIDTLLARRCLNILPSEKRNLSFASSLLDLLEDPSSSLTDIMLKI